MAPSLTWLNVRYLVHKSPKRHLAPRQITTVLLLVQGHLFVALSFQNKVEHRSPSPYLAVHFHFLIRL